MNSTLHMSSPKQQLHQSFVPHRITGVSLIEVLVSIVILMIGLLGLAGLQGRAFTAQMESYQRSQALVLLQDMASRIEANRKNAALYINNNPLGTGTASCPGTTGNTRVDEDLCDWHTALLGAAETIGGANVGAIIGARGCIFREVAPATGKAATYQVVVAWQGLNSTSAPDNTTAASPRKCGLGLYKDRDGVVNEALHRAIAIPVSVADLL